MSLKLFLRAVTKFLLGIAMLGLLLFLPAGTLNYPNAWLFTGLLSVLMIATGAALMLKNPELLEKRLHAKEKQSEQKSVILLSALMFPLGFALAGLDFRFSWLPLPRAVSYIFSAVFLLGYLMYAEVLRENAYLSRTVEVRTDQKVVDTGLYGVIRHPMYSATLVIFLSMPLILGSLLSLAVFLVYPFIIAKRIKYEELLLEGELSGYAEYKKRVKYKLIPYIW